MYTCRSFVAIESIHRLVRAYHAAFLGSLTFCGYPMAHGWLLATIELCVAHSGPYQDRQIGFLIPRKSPNMGLLTWLHTRINFD